MRVSLTGKKSYQAFSLVEMLLVIIILGVVAGLSVPSFRKSFSGIELKTQTQDLVYLMRYAQSRAVTKNIWVRLNLDVNLKDYYLTESEEPSKPQTFKPLKGRMGAIGKMPANLIIESKDAAIDFFPDGTIDKNEIRLCRERECFVITTQEQRGNIRFFSADK